MCVFIFAQAGDGDAVTGFVTKNPPGEVDEDVRAREVRDGVPEGDYKAEVLTAQQNRITSIVKVIIESSCISSSASLLIIVCLWQVIAHYEAGTITPFSVLGLTLTQEVRSMLEKNLFGERFRPPCHHC